MRNPFLAALIALLFGPAIGSLYIKQGKWAVLYLCLSALWAIAPFIAAHFELISTHPANVMALALLTIQLTGAAHCFMIVRQKTYPFDMKWYSRWHMLIAFFIVPLIFAATFRLFVFEPFYIPFYQMSPNLDKGDYIFVKKFAYKKSPPERGDVVVLKTADINYIARIIGLPGDTIQIMGDFISINEVRVPRQELEDYAIEENSKKSSFKQALETLPEGKEYRVLNSYELDQISGAPIYIVPDGSYFLLGDNRGQAWDSQDQTTFGFIPQENIMGLAVLVVWNNDVQKFRIHEIH